MVQMRLCSSTMAYTDPVQRPQLPYEINSKILDFLGPEDIRNLSLVNAQETSSGASGLFDRLEDANLLSSNLLAMLHNPQQESSFFNVEKGDQFVTYEYAFDTVTFNADCGKSDSILGVSSVSCLFIKGKCTAVSAKNASTKMDLKIQDEGFLNQRVGMTVEKSDSEGNNDEEWFFERKQMLSKSLCLCALTCL